MHGFSLILCAATVFAIGVLAAGTGGFTPPGRDERLRAIGGLGDLPEELGGAFIPAGDFDPVPEPGPHDWLAQHKETGQTFGDYSHADFPAPDQERSALYLQPIGSFQSTESPDLADLEEFAEAFFALEVRCRPPLHISGTGITERENPHTGNRQLLTTDILRLLHSRLPADAYCMLGITMIDLYPDPSWNFVFGQASPRHRVGVYSFARYDPALYGREDRQDVESVLLSRSCKVLAHETSHMFNMDHCVYFHCLMNGSNHLEESDARPTHLCPVCLRKLHHSVGFDPVERYRNLLEFWKERGGEPEAGWLKARIEYVCSKD